MQAERALRRIQARLAGDPIFKNLGDAPIQRRDSGSGLTLSVATRTDEQIQVSADKEATPAGAPGNAGVYVDFTQKTYVDDISGGLHYGVVCWRTNDPHTFVRMIWCSADPGAPDRLLTAVREELGREDLSLTPMRKLDWPYATTWERLAQLLPPDPPSGVAPKSADATATPQPEGSYRSPLDTLAMSRRARARKDWRAYFLCLTPASCGAVFREMLFQTGMGQMTEVAKAIEERLKLNLLDEKGRLLISEDKELWAFFLPPGGSPEKLDEAADAWLYESVRKRVGDVPQFLAECMQHFPDIPGIDRRPLESMGVRIEGDRASAYAPLPPLAPSPDEAEKRVASAYLPRYLPIRLRRINGCWLISNTYGHDY